VNNITVAQLKTILKEANIIDIRSRNDYHFGHIPNATNIPMNELLTNPDQYLDKAKKYYIYCNHGSQSLNTCNLLSTKGFQTINIIGGYLKWLENQGNNM